MSKVYVSYTYDSTEHLTRVREFATRLKPSGIEVRIDTDANLDPPEGRLIFSQAQFAEAEFIADQPNVPAVPGDRDILILSQNASNFAVLDYYTVLKMLRVGEYAAVSSCNAPTTQRSSCT
jgi:hypothetical protein